MPKPLKPVENTLTNSRQLDVARIVTMLMFDGMSTGTIAKKLSTTKVAIEEQLKRAKTRDMIQKAHEDRMELVAHIPIANYANRLRRLEAILLQTTDEKIMLQALREAREETKNFFREDEPEQKAPQITVNIQKYDGGDDGLVPRAVEEAAKNLTKINVAQDAHSDN